MPHRTKGISFVVVCIITLFASHEVNGKGHDVTPGMRLEDALLVVKRCVIQASAFKDPRAAHQKHKELRAQDTLEYAGITDDARLDTLQRYLVRNTELGVQSVWGVRLGEPYARPYLIPNSGLSGIEKGWSLERLAREIITNAGLPYVTYARAAKLAADCRYKAFGGKPPTDKRPMSYNIDRDLAGYSEAFRKCLLEDGDRGLPGVGIIDGEGDFYPYAVNDILRLRIDAAISAGTYGQLVGDLHDRLYVDLSVRLTAQIIVGNWFIGRKTPGCRSVSFPVFGLCDPTAAIPVKRESFETRQVSQMAVPTAPAMSILASFRCDQNSPIADVPPDVADALTGSIGTVRDIMVGVENKLRKTRKC